jgi:hypothetical protein
VEIKSGAKTSAEKTTLQHKAEIHLRRNHLGYIYIYPLENEVVILISQYLYLKDLFIIFITI